MNHIKQICKDPAKVDQKLQGKQFLLGRYFSLKANCRHRSKKDKKFQRSKRQKILEIQNKLNEQEFQEVKKQQKVQMKTQIKNCEMQDERVQKKQTKVLQPSQPIDYKYFEPLHRLWQGYIEDLISGEKNEESACLKILRGDLVGAKIEIIYSKVQSYLGQKGIIIKQTLRSFVVVKTPNQNSQINQQKTIISLLKNEIIFLLECGNRNFIVNGNTLVYRPSDRSKHKFKFRIGQKLNLSFLGNFITDCKQQDLKE